MTESVSCSWVGVVMQKLLIWFDLKCQKSKCRTHKPKDRLIDRQTDRWTDGPTWWLKVGKHGAVWINAKKNGCCCWYARRPYQILSVVLSLSLWCCHGFYVFRFILAFLGCAHQSVGLLVGRYHSAKYKTNGPTMHPRDFTNRKSKAHCLAEW